jgi:predicted GIY-YIG superfamily endonuclease
MSNKKCFYCKKVLKQVKNKFCSNSCSASFNNKRRARMSTQTKGILKEKNQKYNTKQIEKIIKKRNFKSIKDMREYDETLYRNFLKLRIENKILYQDLIKIIKDQTKMKHYSESEKKRIAKLAKKFNTQKDFRERYFNDYQKAWRINKYIDNSFFKQIYKHTDKIGNKYKRCIYIILFKNINSVYVGLTCNYNRRKNEHLSDSHNIDVKTYLNKGEEYKFIQETEYLNIEESIKQEYKIVKKYKEKGYTILNKNPTGGLGSIDRKWNKELIIQEATRYETYHSFRENSKAYHAARRRKILNEIKELFKKD